MFAMSHATRTDVCGYSIPEMEDWIVHFQSRFASYPALEIIAVHNTYLQISMVSINKEILITFS